MKTILKFSILITTFSFATASAQENYSLVGKKFAPVEIESYLDHTCGMCRYAFREILPEVIKKYVDQGKARLVFREFPLIRSENDMLIASFAQCAGEQRRYMEFVSALYATSSKVERKELVEIASKVNINTERLENCIKSEKGLKAVQSDIKKGERLKVEGTPTYFINGKELVGAQPFEEFKKIIDKELDLELGYH